MVSGGTRGSLVWLGPSGGWKQRQRVTRGPQPLGRRTPRLELWKRCQRGLELEVYCVLCDRAPIFVPGWGGLHVKERGSWLQDYIVEKRLAGNERVLVFSFLF